MMEQSTETNMSSPQRKVGLASDYSARIQEAMRYDRLQSSVYPLVMTILDAVLQGYTEERWQEGQQRSLTLLRQQAPEKAMAHADEATRYEQTVSCLKDLALWPW
jgi:hypothetical protein